MTWQDRFDRLLKAMVQGEPHKAEKYLEKTAAPGASNKRKPDPSE
jgi:hypothetical protein